MKKNIFKSNTFSLILAVLMALTLRSILFEPFHIPSGSMEPTLLTGDYLFVTKYSYGWSRFSFPFGIIPIKERVWNKAPERGDIAVFKLPSDTSVNYIKRVIGIPGDKVQLIGGILYINNKAVPRVLKDKTQAIYNGQKMDISIYEEELPNGKKHLIQEISDSEIADNTPAFFVPKDHYFMLGDNRDNSRDSRYEDVAFVPKENLLGPAGILFYSNGAPSSILAFWQWNDWVKGLRFNRFFKKAE